MTDSADNPFIALIPESQEDLPATDRFPAAGHLWDEAEIDALILAWASGRPLLVRGEAGSGKSQIARAAAAHLGNWEPLVVVIHSRFEALDLLYRVDLVERLADAQVQGCLDATNEKYVKPGRLWQAMDEMRAGRTVPVLLIDEIDKADADVPNALLEVLGNRSFTVPPLGDRVIRGAAERLPLIIITTNEERELPAAFVRRCVVLNLNPPDQDQAFIDWLVARGRVHRGLAICETARVHAAQQVLADRKKAFAAGYPKVGLAEYIDLLTALHHLTRGGEGAARPVDEIAADQIRWLQRLGAYALIKNAGQDQKRPPLPAPEAPAPTADAAEP